MAELFRPSEHEPLAAAEWDVAVRDPVVETERLVLRPMVAGDLDDLCEIFGDPAVTAAFGAAPLDREQTRRWLARSLDHQREHGYGLFAVCLKGDDRLIGDCGLEHMDLRSAWGFPDTGRGRESSLDFCSN